MKPTITPRIDSVPSRRSPFVSFLLSRRFFGGALFLICAVLLVWFLIPPAPVELGGLEKVYPRLASVRGAGLRACIRQVWLDHGFLEQLAPSRISDPALIQAFQEFSASPEWRGFLTSPRCNQLAEPLRTPDEEPVSGLSGSAQNNLLRKVSAESALYARIAGFFATVEALPLDPASAPAPAQLRDASLVAAIVNDRLWYELQSGTPDSAARTASVALSAHLLASRPLSARLRHDLIRVLSLPLDSASAELLVSSLRRYRRLAPPPDCAESLRLARAGHLRVCDDLLNTSLFSRTRILSSVIHLSGSGFLASCEQLAANWHARSAETSLEDDLLRTSRLLLVPLNSKTNFDDVVGKSGLPSFFVSPFPHEYFRHDWLNALELAAECKFAIPPRSGSFTVSPWTGKPYQLTVFPERIQVRWGDQYEQVLSIER